MDDQDFVFTNKSISGNQEKECSDFLRNRKLKTLKIKVKKTTKAPQSK